MFGKLFSGDWFFKDGDSVVVDYGFYNTYTWDYYNKNNAKLLREEIYTDNFMLVQGDVSVFVMDISYLYSFKGIPAYLKLGIGDVIYSLEVKGLNPNKSSVKYKIADTYLNIGISVDAWQNQTPFGKNNRQYFLLIGDLITLSVDYKSVFNRTINIDSQYSKYVKDVSPLLKYGISTSWVTKNRILFGWGFYFQSYLIKENSYGRIVENFFNIHLGYIF